jgi:hypothetical protein
VGVEKVLEQNAPSATSVRCRVFLFSAWLGGGWQNGCCGFAEEPHESFDVLGHGCQEELLAHELQSAQAQATQSDLILQFREQSFYLLSVPLGSGELGRVRQLSGALPGWFLHVDGKIAKRSAGALGF